MDNLVLVGDLKPYREQALGTWSKQYKRLIREADRCTAMELPDEHPKKSSTYMGIAIVNLALAYRLSGEQKYLIHAKRFMNTVISYEKWGNAHLVNVDLSASWILFGLSLGYDWLRPYLSGEEKSRVAAKLKHHAKIIYDYRKETYGTDWSTNYYQNHNWINMNGLATAGYVLVGEDEYASEYIAMAKENFERVYSYLPDDGSNYEGVVYWRYGGMWLFVYAHLLKQQEGIDYFKSCGYLRNTFYYRLYQACGDYSQQMNFGDCHDRHSGHTPCVYYKTAAEYGDGYAQTLGNMVLENFLEEEAEQSKVKPGILPEAAFEFLWYNPEVQEKDLQDLPLSRYFEDLGLLMIRENWKRDSKVLTIKCGYPGGKKQWKMGWYLNQEEGIDCLALAHHHPDNLAYIFARGSEYLTCEDGYNRNLLPDNHNVILVDGCYTDAQDVNDVYMESVALRWKSQTPKEICKSYFGTVTGLVQDGTVLLYRGETAGIYPQQLKMRQVSRTLFTDGLRFWVFMDICRSEQEHVYQIISNTDYRAEKLSDGQYIYPMQTGNIHYTVFSDKPVEERFYEQDIVAVMTTQEPDKVCRTHMQTLTTASSVKQTEQLFVECFTFEDDPAQLEWKDDVLTIWQGKRRSCMRMDREIGTVTVTMYDGNEEKSWAVD